jgi:DNA polymerase III delta prime subunit
MQDKHYILNEVHRPDTLEGYVCDEYLRKKIEGWIESKNIPMLGFFGKPGSGKTTLAKILVKSLDSDCLYINVGDKRSMENIREEIIPFVSTMSFKDSPKIVILDEATSSLPAYQVLLLNLIETYSLNTRFILTGNYPERLIEPLRSRLEDYNLKPPSKKHVAKHIVNILNTENIQYEISDVAAIINAYYPDLRRTINNIQKHVIDNKLALSQTLTNDADTENNLIQLLSKKHSKTFGEIRKLVADSEISDFDSLYKKLYTDIEKYAPGNEGLVIITINEHIFQSASVIDKEICFFACIARILETI